MRDPNPLPTDPKTLPSADQEQSKPSAEFRHIDSVDPYVMRDQSQFTYEYREFVQNARWYKHAAEGNSAELNYIILGIAGEAGEAADQWKKITRVLGLHEGWENTSDENRMKLVHEAGDVLWYIQCLCVFLGIDLQELMLLNTVKLYNRINERTEHGLGEIQWPLSRLPYEDASSLTRDTESQITHRSASRSTDTDT